MPYPYGMQNSPAVGNGLGGLPRRTTGVTSTPVVTYPKYSPIFKTDADRALGFKIGYNNVITETVGSYKATGNFSATVHAILRNYSTFTFNDALTGGGNAIFPAGYGSCPYVEQNFVSLTYGGESNFNSYSYIWSFTPDYLYRARSATTSTSVQYGFSVNGDESKYYILASGVISIIDKTTLTATVTKSYSGAGTFYCGWIYGNNLHSLDSNGRLLVVDKETLAVVSVTVTGVSFPSGGINQSFAQNATSVAWTDSTRTYVFVLDKATLVLKAYNIPWNVGGTYTNFFACGDRIILLAFESGTSPYNTYVIEFDSNTAYPLYQIQSNNFAESTGVRQSGCFIGSNILSIYGLQLGSQQVPTTLFYWNTKPSEVTASTVIPSFSGFTVTNLRGSTTALSVYSTSSGTSTATNSTNTFTTFTKYPYVVNY